MIFYYSHIVKALDTILFDSLTNETISKIENILYLLGYSEFGEDFEVRVNYQIDDLINVSGSYIENNILINIASPLRPDKEKLLHEIAQTFDHEYIHYTQQQKQSKYIFHHTRDWKDYYSHHTEISAYAYNIAREIYIERSIILNQPLCYNIIRNADIGSYEKYKDDTILMKKLYKKIYKYYGLIKKYEEYTSHSS